MEVQETKIVWIVLNTVDLTEGRTPPYNWKVCETEATALRIGANNYIMGSDCPIEKSFAVRINNTWLYPGQLERSTNNDKKEQEKLEKKKSLEQRLRESGFTPEDIEMLKNK